MSQKWHFSLTVIGTTLQLAGCQARGGAFPGHRANVSLRGRGEVIKRDFETAVERVRGTEERERM